VKRNRIVTFANAAVEQDAPRKPHRTRQVQRIFLRIITLSELEPTKRTETVEKVQHEGNDMNRQADQDPQSVAERMKKRPKV